MKAKTDLIAEINITPFTDVVLVLLIIFIISAAAYTQLGFNLKLPSAGSCQSVKNSEINIFVSRGGEIYLGAHPVKAGELKKQLKSFYLKNYRTAILSGDQKVAYGRIIEVLDLVRSCGFSDIALAAEKGGEVKF